MSCHFPSAGARDVSFTNVRNAAHRSRVCIEFDGLSPASHVVARTIAENSTRAFGSVLSKQNDRLFCSVISGIIRRGFLCRALVIGMACASSAHAFVLENLSWTRDRTVVMQLSLGPGPFTLIDGSSSFNQVAQSALAIWNPYLLHLKFSSVANSPVPNDGDDDEMSVFFSNNIFGEAFDHGTLAITLLNSRNGVLEETDTIFNTFYQWDSYRGNLRPSVHGFSPRRDSRVRPHARPGSSGRTRTTRLRDHEFAREQSRHGAG